MKMLHAVFALILFSALSLIGLSRAGAGDTNPPPRVTYELRDGSRVVGQSDDQFIRLHSPLLGDLKLAVAQIRTIDCLWTNSVKVTTAQGDNLTVSFADARLTVKTSFGKINLAVGSVRKLTVSASGGAGGAGRPGMIALWSGEDNGHDAVGTNDAILTDVNFADGQVGRAFSLDGSGSWMKVNASSALDVGKGDGLTVSVWIKPANVVSFHPILEWEITRQKNAVSLWLGHLPQDRGVLMANLGDDSGNSHVLCSLPGIIVSGRFQQVTLTYDKESGVGRLFVNGKIVVEENLGVFNPRTSDDLFISRRPCDQPGDWTYNTFFDGLLDEISIYDRALSPLEVHDLAIEDNHGKLLQSPLPNSAQPPFSRGTRNF